MVGGGGRRVHGVVRKQGRILPRRLVFSVVFSPFSILCIPGTSISFFPPPLSISLLSSQERDVAQW